MAARKPAAKTKPRSVVRRVASTAPTVAPEARTYELRMFHPLGEQLEETKYRLRVVGAPEENIICAGSKDVLFDCFAGQISELHGTKWTAYGYGLIPVQSFGVIREVFPSMDAPEKKNDQPPPPATANEKAGEK